jgi:hypothetical protein
MAVSTCTSHRCCFHEAKASSIDSFMLGPYSVSAYRLAQQRQRHGDNEKRRHRNQRAASYFSRSYRSSPGKDMTGV